MTEFQPPKILPQYRPLLLALEAIGWLHMTGKAKIDFLRVHGGQKSDYEYEKWDKKESPPFPWDDLLKWVKGDFSMVGNSWPGTFTEFLTKHAGRDAGMLGLLQAGHAMASGIEKNLPKVTSEYLRQDATHMWLSTAFGQPIRNLLAVPSPESLTETGWKRLLGQIEGLLTELEKFGSKATTTSIEDWWDWRERAIGIDPDGWLRRAFTSTLAETRLPNNDVTLFDQSYVAAALFKSAAAGAILEGNLFPWTNSSLKQQTRWRLLTVGIGADHYEARAVKIGDWTGARRALNEFFTGVRRLVEVDLAVGSLLYADGEVCVFSFPGERFGYEQSGYQGGNLQIAEWEKWLTKQIDCYAREANLETPPYCMIIEPSRSLVGMTAEIRKARETMAVPLHRDWDIIGEDKTEGHVCPVCLVRRNGDKTSKQTRCKTCYDRRDQRCGKWLEGALGSDSIWISEVADANDRVALVTMSLDIEPWLDGTRLDALRTQAIAEWRKSNPFLNKSTNPIDPNKSFDSLFQHIKGNLASFDSADPVLGNLQEGYQHELDWMSFFSKIVEDRTDSPQWSNLDDNRRAKWLTHQLFRKLASPGRIYRFQRQAKEFFYARLSDFRKHVLEDQNGWRFRRLLLKPEKNSSFQWNDRQSYSSRFTGMAIDLLYRAKTHDFVTISNLGRVLKSTNDKNIFKGAVLELKDDDNRPAGKLQVELVDDAPGTLNTYEPVIPLEVSPVRFRVLLPLEKASECVDLAVRKWADKFCRVWDRLPLRVGVIAFPRKTPFQAVIEMTRTVEEKLQSVGEEQWRVVGHAAKDGSVAMKLSGPDAILETHCIPVRFPSGREDVFYLYFAVEDNELRFPGDFQHPNGQIYRHVTDIRYGDGVRIYPSRIGTVFMDDTGCRFDVPEQYGLMEWQRMRDLWKLIDRAAPSQTALRGAWSELVERCEGWKGPDGIWLEGGKEAWLDLARAVFHERLDARGACSENLVQAAGDGLLDWCLEWHITVLKKQVSGGAR